MSDDSGLLEALGLDYTKAHVVLRKFEGDPPVYEGQKQPVETLVIDSVPGEGSTVARYAGDAPQDGETKEPVETFRTNETGDVIERNGLPVERRCSAPPPHSQEGP